MPDFELPDLGEGVTEGEVIEWKVSEGAQVTRDQVLCVIGTDKATVDIPSPYSGRVEALLASEGQVVHVGQVLIRVAGQGEDAGPKPIPAPPRGTATKAPPSNPRPAQGARILALPSVRRSARQRGRSLENVPGSGPGGRVRMQDLEAGGRVIPLRGSRRVMAERLAEAHRRVPQVTVVLECDMGAVESLVAGTRGSAEEVGVLGLVCLACLDQCGRQPIFNASLDEQALEVVYHPAVHLGIAVQTEDGLKVATLRDADRLTAAQLHRQLPELVEGARAGTLGAAQLAGATFTVSSGGRLGGLLATPIVNWPNVATLGVHEIQDRAVVRQGRVEAGRVANLSLSFDHRVIDGMTASAFLYGVRDFLERADQPKP